MKGLFVVGLAVIILGILSFFVAIPHSENHGIKAGDVNIGVQTHEQRKGRAGNQRCAACGRSWTDDRRPQELSRTGDILPPRPSLIRAEEAACVFRIWQRRCWFLSLL